MRFQFLFYICLGLAWATPLSAYVDASQAKDFSFQDWLTKGILSIGSAKENTHISMPPYAFQHDPQSLFFLRYEKETLFLYLVLTNLENSQITSVSILETSYTPFLLATPIIAGYFISILKVPLPLHRLKEMGRVDNIPVIIYKTTSPSSQEESIFFTIPRLYNTAFLELLNLHKLT